MMYLLTEETMPLTLRQDCCSKRAVSKDGDQSFALISSLYWVPVREQLLLSQKPLHRVSCIHLKQHTIKHIAV